MCITLGKKHASITTGTVQTGHSLKWSPFDDFIETHYLTKQVKSIKELHDHITNMYRIGALKSGMAEYFFNKHTVGVSDNES